MYFLNANKRLILIPLCLTLIVSFFLPLGEVKVVGKKWDANIIGVLNIRTDLENSATGENLMDTIVNMATGNLRKAVNSITISLLVAFVLSVIMLFVSGSNSGCKIVWIFSVIGLLLSLNAGITFLNATKKVTELASGLTGGAFALGLNNLIDGDMLTNGLNSMLSIKWGLGFWILLTCFSVISCLSLYCFATRNVT